MVPSRTKDLSSCQFLIQGASSLWSRSRGLYPRALSILIDVVHAFMCVGWMTGYCTIVYHVHLTYAGEGV